MRAAWREPDTSSNDNSTVEDRDKDVHTRLSNCQIPNYKELLSEENLVEAELAPAIAMKVPVGDLEAAFRQKRPAAGEPSRPTKRPRRRDPARPAATRAAPAPTREPAERKPIVRVAPQPAATEVEEGEIPTTTEATVVVLDEDDAPAAAAVPEAGQVTVASDPPLPRSRGGRALLQPPGLGSRP